MVKKQTRINYKKRYENSVKNRMQWRSKFYKMKAALHAELKKAKLIQANGIVRLPANVFFQIERQLQPKFRFKEENLFKQGIEHISLTDGNHRIAILIPLKY